MGSCTVSAYFVAAAAAADSTSCASDFAFGDDGDHIGDDGSPAKNQHDVAWEVAMAAEGRIDERDYCCNGQWRMSHYCGLIMASYEHDHENDEQSHCGQRLVYGLYCTRSFLAEYQWLE